ncbi:hypothetical protein P691DRAFT_778492 [Macrolepiota fuliginosa MF-IS2]|uniref:Uncharacterized protein n=1 Tax=Macrolepiota fuliginosa MF-IS2 TaxID=1400762 RepID=A0A9P6BZZ4_9AGAR|nr:hypothetical protein P691DRAFT_778492 [Macrolepiota fuliginosa MF-IS2]
MRSSYNPTPAPSSHNLAPTPTPYYPTSGSVVNTNGSSYRLIEEVSAHNPTTVNSVIKVTQSAPIVLGAGIFVPSGTSMKSSQMTASGNGISVQWITDRASFAMRLDGDADVVIATGRDGALSIKARTRSTRGDNHPGNWIISITK